MKRAKRKAPEKTVRGWREARTLLERWRKDLKTLAVELKQPRVIEVVPIDFVSGEPVEREGKPTKRLRGQLIYFTNADLTIRRPSGAADSAPLYGGGLLNLPALFVLTTFHVF